ncbi:hypothetical protein [Sporolactobacillus spathodeae]|uniref:Uncharacterized protein n=1 Tax=Sporolactobacillus spathodeae TaxID=1465502 RepID=A0ABS2Q654_9BACL|nr:hypothetical protein [Sporolactobacillus spathodeae]MBM7657272.1 hypothetical protein [Sporolactobacillus spathodeae]
MHKKWSEGARRLREEQDMEDPADSSLSEEASVLPAASEQPERNFLQNKTRHRLVYLSLVWIIKKIPIFVR